MIQSDKSGVGIPITLLSIFKERIHIGDFKDVEKTCKRVGSMKIGLDKCFSLQMATSLC